MLKRSWRELYFLAVFLPALGLVAFLAFLVVFLAAFLVVRFLVAFLVAMGDLLRWGLGTVVPYCHVTSRVKPRAT